MRFFWKRKAVDPVAKPVAASHDAMEDNAVVQWSQRWLIDFIDAFLMRWCQFSLMIGCILGTFGLYATSFNLTAQPAFNGIWAGIQAVSIDGLFFAVWSVWRRSAGKGWLRTWYFCIGVLLMIVAAMVNGVVSYTELHKVATISLTMQELHIDETVFSWSRSVLVVLVAVLITTLPRGKQESVQPVTQPATEQPIQIDTEMILEVLADRLKVTVEETIERRIATIAVPQIEAPTDNLVELDESSIQGNEPESVEVDESQIQGFQTSGRYKSSYALQIEQLYQDNPDISVAEVIRVTGCSRPVATKWLNRVKPA